MFGFVEFLRVVAIGFMAIGLFGAIFCKSIFQFPFSNLLILSALFGLLVQPFLRAYHPYRDEVKAVIKHVESYIREVLPTEALQYPNDEDGKLENALARAIYEFLYRTVEYSPFFTSRINEQIRFFYFYYFTSLCLKIGAVCAVIALVMRILYEYIGLQRIRGFTFIANEFLLGIPNTTQVIFISLVFSLIAYVLSRRFSLAARGIILTELYTRHVFLAYEKEKIQNLAQMAHKDGVLMNIVQRRIDKEKGIFI